MAGDHFPQKKPWITQASGEPGSLGRDEKLTPRSSSVLRDPSGAGGVRLHGGRFGMRLGFCVNLLNHYSMDWFVWDNLNRKP